MTYRNIGVGVGFGDKPSLDEAKFNQPYDIMGGNLRDLCVGAATDDSQLGEIEVSRPMLAAIGEEPSIFTKIL